MATPKIKPKSTRLMKIQKHQTAKDKSVHRIVIPVRYMKKFKWKVGDTLVLNEAINGLWMKKYDSQATE